MTSRQFRLAKRERQLRAVLNKGPRRVHGDGRLLPNLIEPLYVSPLRREILSREAADLIADLRRFDAHDDRRADLEQKLFWNRQRIEGQVA
jgi:hypothetical protein